MLLPDHGSLLGKQCAHDNEPGVRTMLNRRCANLRDSVMKASIGSTIEPLATDVDSKVQRRLLLLPTLRHLLGIYLREHDKSARDAPAGTLPS